MLKIRVIFINKKKKLKKAGSRTPRESSKSAEGKRKNQRSVDPDKVPEEPPVLEVGRAP